MYNGRLGRALLAVLACTGVLVGCSPSSKHKPRRETLTYWAVNMAPTVAKDRAILNRELAKFTGRTGIKVNFQIMSWTTAYTKIMSAVTSGRRPDVIDIGNTWSPALQATGAFLPFDTEAMAAIGGRERFLATAMSATGAPGKPPASIPFLGQSYGLYYNTKLFAQAKIDRPPTTWAEFVADAKKLTKPGQWGFALLGASAAGNAHLGFIFTRQRGGRFFDAAGQPHLDAAPVRAAVSSLLELMTRHEVINPSDAEHSGLNDALAELAHGRAAMVPFQSAGRAYFAQIGFSDYAVAPLPALSPLPRGGAAVRSIVAGTILAIVDDTEHRAAALELVGFLTGKAEQIALNKAYGTLPVVNGAYASSAFADPPTATFGRILREYSQVMPMVPGEGQLESLFGGAISNLWAKAASGALDGNEISSALRKASEQLAAAR